MPFTPRASRPSERVPSWGLYPRHYGTSERVRSGADAERAVSEGALIPFGNGRSYGDSALGPHVARMRDLRHLLGFDDETGVLHVQAGVLLSEILDVFVPRGWFLSVTPGTKLITVGGAIASDVHGKNHHIAGCFSACVRSFRIVLASGEVVVCTPQGTPDLWRATCGGQGLTGIILDAEIALKPIRSSTVEQLTIKTRDLRETFDAFDAHAASPYSVAWIDCLASGRSLGRSLLMLGDFADDGDLTYRSGQRLRVPFHLPSVALNRWSVRAFNALYYGKALRREQQARVGIDTFFYPLDAIGNWNRIYGKAGFVQYQFILPLESSFDGMQKILTEIAAAGEGSFLAVLKLYGPANANWLSFPLEGYSLALDFKANDAVFNLLDRLDRLVVAHGGRIYLSKDARVSREVFEAGYPNIDRFRDFRRANGMDVAFQSRQSIRLGL